MAQVEPGGRAGTISRPQIVLGLAVGSAMNPVAALGAHAVLSRERGLPLTYPGHPHLLTECTDARLIAEAIEWAWGAPQAHGEAFNIGNGDVILWPTLYPRLAAHFGLSWQYADTNFAAQRPLAVPPLVSTIKLRQAGFAACIDTEECILQHLQAMQAQRYLPPS